MCCDFARPASLQMAHGYLTVSFAHQGMPAAHPPPTWGPPGRQGRSRLPKLMFCSQGSACPPARWLSSRSCWAPSPVSQAGGGSACPCTHQDWSRLHVFPVGSTGSSLLEALSPFSSFFPKYRGVIFIRCHVKCCGIFS